MSIKQPEKTTTILAGIVDNLDRDDMLDLLMWYPERYSKMKSLFGPRNTAMDYTETVTKEVLRSGNHE